MQTKEETFMAKTEKSTALYSHPFSKAYWRDAAAELKSTKMIVIAALMIALRVATKGLAVPIAPNLDLFNLASFIKALSAMIIGPVLAIPAALVSDFLGVMIWDGGNYFLPYALQEIASSFIWALLLYRTEVTPWKVLIGRFSICLFVNIILGTPIHMLYQIYTTGQSTYVLTLPRILKNLFMFPIESVVMTLFLSILVPITYRMKLSYHNCGPLKFTRVQIVALVVMFCVGLGCVGAYGIYNYNTSNQASWLSSDDTYAYAAAATEKAQQAGLIEENQIIVVNKVYKELGGDTQIQFNVYTVAEGGDGDTYLYFRVAKLSKDAPLEYVGTASATFSNDKVEGIYNLAVQFIK